MNTKELASVAGVSRNTLIRTAKKLYPGLVKRGTSTRFNEEQAKAIMKEVRKKNMVSPLVQDEHVPAQDEHSPIQAEPVDYEVLGKMIGVAITAALAPLVDKMDKLATQKALPEPVTENSYSLVAYCRIKGIKVDRSMLAMHGKELRKIAKSRDMELTKIPDERWGFVNSYPVEILDEYFAA